MIHLGPTNKFYSTSLSNQTHHLVKKRDLTADVQVGEGLKPRSRDAEEESEEVQLYSSIWPPQVCTLWVATDLMSLTCDICRADWKWLEARGCLRRCVRVYRGKAA